MENNKCLLVVDDCHGNLVIFCEETSAIDAAINNRRFKKSLNRDKIGHDIPLLAFDEARHMLVICAPTKVCFIVPLSAF
jgi:hypothetical protein